LITVRVPGDKSISHRVLMLAPLADGSSRISGLAAGADLEATAAAMRALGVAAARLPAGGGPLELSGPVSLRSPDSVIDCGNSGTTARLILGLIAGHPVRARLDGDASLRRRPMARVTDPLRAAGAALQELGEPGHLPIEVMGRALRPIEHESPVASAQVKGALLLAGLAAGVPVSVVEPGPSRDHTERLLRAMGVEVETRSNGDAYRVRLEPPAAPLRPLQLAVPGDFSSAAYWLGLALLGGAGPGLRIEGVGLNPRRTGLLRVLAAMGAGIEPQVTSEVAAEPLGTLEVRPGCLRGVEVPPECVPTMLDEIPILACLAARADGVTVIRGAAELRVKESDRLRALHRNLSALGVSCRELEDGLEVEGSDAPLRGRVSTEGDHRIAMSFAVLGALAGNAIELDDPGCVGVSYPGFWTELKRIGAGARAR
jgi:3-phosphoshikimate 1-carboxyvinyltransferase